MKVHDIVNELFGKNQDEQNFNSLIKTAISRWNRITQLDPSLKNDTQALHDYVSNFFANGANGRPGLTPAEIHEIPAPANGIITPSAVQDYIKTYAGKWQVRSLGHGKAPADNSAQAPGTNAPNTNAPGGQGSEVSGGASHDAQDHDLAPGVQIVNQEPIIIKYQNKDYGLNDNGEWMHMASGKVQHQGFQAWLDQQHNKSMSVASEPATAPVAASNPQWTGRAKPGIDQRRAARRAITTPPATGQNTVNDKAPATPGSTNEGIDLSDILWRKMKLQEAREQLTESQNVFRDAEGNQVARRIMTSEIPSTVDWLEKITGLDFTQEKDKEGYPTKWLGTTGRKKGTEKEPGSSGDLDLSVDDKSIAKEELKAILIKWCLQQGIPQDKIENRKDFRDGWVAMSGDSVHFKTPINGDVKNGFAQTDFMFGDPKWQAFAMKGGRENSPYKGMARHIILASIISALNPNYTWSYKNGIIDKSVNPKKPTTIEGGKDPRTLSKLTGIPIGKLNTADDIIDAIGKRPDYEQLVAKARETLAHDNIQLPETAPVHTAAWMRKL